MPLSPQRGRTATSLIVIALSLGLAGCAAEPGATGPADEATDSGGENSSGDAEQSFVVLPGTGTYVIGQDIPYGGFQLHGEPDEQPAGCTWAILDADGGTTLENQGSYVFITDIHEAATFETSGCPDWEQFE